jgi:hypothetical protein
MIIHAGSSVCGGGGPTFDYLGTRAWIIWHHLPDLSNSLRSGRCHSGLSRVRARISRAGRATGRWGRVQLCATHRPRPEAGPCGLPPCCIDRCVQRVGARWGAQAGGGRAIFRGAAKVQHKKHEDNLQRRAWIICLRENDSCAPTQSYTEP